MRPFIALACLFTLSASACVGADEIAETDQAELDPGTRDYLIYTITQGGRQIAKVLVTNTAGDGFDSNREYWYVSDDWESRVAPVFTVGAAQSWSTIPTGLGTLSFKMARRPTWTPVTADGRAVDMWTNPLTPTDRAAMLFNMTHVGNTWSGNIQWWHTSTANVFGPSRTFPTSIQQLTGANWLTYVATPL